MSLRPPLLMRKFLSLWITSIRLIGLIENRVRHLQALVDSAPGHQETPKPPAGGFLYQFHPKTFHHKGKQSKTEDGASDRCAHR